MGATATEVVGILSDKCSLPIIAVDTQPSRIGTRHQADDPTLMTDPNV